MGNHKNNRLAIVFDFGGVLIDWNPRYLYRRFFDGDGEALEQFLVEVGFTEWNVQQDAGRPFTEAVEELSRRYPDHAHLIRAYDTHWEETVGGPISGTVEVLSELYQAGYPLYALSNWSEEKFKLIRPLYTFFDWFDDILISGELKLIKPDPRIFLALLERAGRRAEECLFIDDSAANIAVAGGLGFKTIQFESPEHLRATLAGMEILAGRNGRG